MTTAFFIGKREQFFRPLTRSDRECCAAVMRSLYDRVHGPNADYSEALTRDLVISIILQSLSAPGLRALAFEPGRAISAEEERAYSGELLRSLKEHGWLEDYKDPIDLKPILKLTRAGKDFSEVISNLDNSRLKTRHRNMRSANKALSAFLSSQDVDELLDGYSFASRVVEDLQEDIEYFRSLLQSLTREALEQKLAWGDFNEFIEKRFAKEYSVRLVADSAERHRGSIVELLDQCRARSPEVRAAVDAALLQGAPWLEEETKRRSPMIWLCDRIETMVEAACNLKLPMLRSEMNNYVKRFTSLLRQALSLDYSAESPLGRSMSWLKGRPQDERNDLLDALAERMGTAKVRLPGFSSLQWTIRERTVDHDDPEALVVDESSRVDAAMRRAEAEAFAFSERQVVEQLMPFLLSGVVRLSELPADSALAVVMNLHAVGAARSADGKTVMTARKLDITYETEYFIADDYELTPQSAPNHGGSEASAPARRPDEQPAGT